MVVTQAVKVALNALVDIASHSRNGQLVTVPAMAKRLHMSISRIELLIKPLRESGLVVGVKGRTGGYQLSKDPRFITIKDIVLAMNRIKKRKVEVSDMAKDLYQSLEAYMMNCISNATLTCAVKDHIPRFSEVQTVPERKPCSPKKAEAKAIQEKRSKGKLQKMLKTSFKKVEKVSSGPNSIFNFADYLNRESPAN